jgi:Protein of unknown function (DUF2852)
MLFLIMILAFIAWWPLGLLVLAFMIGTGRMAYAMGCWSHRCNDFRGYDGTSRWQSKMEWMQDHWQSKIERLQDKMDRMRSRMERAGSGGDAGASSSGSPWGSPRSSGNRAFDEYREQTLKRLQEEQREFREFLERLRFAKDRREFDQFMAERRDPPRDEGPQPQAT